MADRISVGVITNTDGAHLDAYYGSLANCREVAEVSVADPSGRSLELARRLLKDKFRSGFTDVGALLKQPPPMVLVSLEAAEAPAAITAALEADCHVLAEKPACTNPADFEKLVRLADSKHRHLMLAFANRLHPVIQKARQLRETGQLGKLYGMEMHLIADQTRLTRPDYQKSWFAHKDRAGGGHLIWLGIHWIDLAAYLTGGRICEVAGFAGNVGGQPIDVEDSAAMTMRFQDGTFGTLTSGFYLDRGYHSFIKIWGSHGWLQIELLETPAMQWYSQHDPSGKIQAYTGPMNPAGYPPLVHAAVRAAAGLQPPPVNSAESLQALRTVFALYQAATEKRNQIIESA